LAHVRFGTKVIEVATFRRQVEVEPADEGVAPETGAEVPRVALPAAEAVSPAPRPHDGARGAHDPHAHTAHDPHAHAGHRDNTFGTDEEDAFRRDFTINALFYDIATFSIIDFVGGLEDLKKGVVRCIGDPDVRFHEDPVRMQRAVSFAARLGFAIDPPIAESIRRHAGLLATAAPARLMDEYYKILRSGGSARIFAALRDAGLLQALSPLLHDAAQTPEFGASLARLDGYRSSFETFPESLTNAILLGSLIVPLGFSQAAWPAWLEEEGKPGLNLGVLPLARRDVERIHQMLLLQRRLREPSRSGHARRMLMQRGAFADALTWLEIHGDAPETLAYWRDQRTTTAAGFNEPAPGPRRRRRRRSGRRRRPGPPEPGRS
jgi:poly(A) polymerase